MSLGCKKKGNDGGALLPAQRAGKEALTNLPLWSQSKARRSSLPGWAQCSSRSTKAEYDLERCQDGPKVGQRKQAQKIKENPPTKQGKRIEDP